MSRVKPGDCGRKQHLLQSTINSVTSEVTFFEIHAGSDYRDFGLTDGLLLRGALVVVPTLGLTQGRQLAFYANARKHGVTLRC